MARNYASLKDESVRIFKNPILDLFSRVHWSVPLFFWIPVVIVSLYKGFSSGVSLPLTVLLFVAALGFWTLAEYVLHRFIFHFHPTTALGKRISFLTHGVHHDYPNDSKRLVMPPLLGAPLAAIFYLTFYWVLGEVYVFPFFAGFISGYLVYDMMHYAIHHAKSSNRLFQEIKTHHMVHHFNDAESGFGVSSKLWDIVFQTLFVAKGKEKLTK
jgi:sterol desaturase/sphingolipid hydroxylase (fatty acid hydroxylase superfamily)